MSVSVGPVPVEPPAVRRTRRGREVWVAGEWLPASDPRAVEALSRPRPTNPPGPVIRRQGEPVADALPVGHQRGQYTPHPSERAAASQRGGAATKAARNGIDLTRYRGRPRKEEEAMPRVIEPRPCVVCGTEFTPPPAPRLREVCSDECHTERKRRQSMSANEAAARAAAFTAERAAAAAPMSVDDLAEHVTNSEPVVESGADHAETIPLPDEHLELDEGSDRAEAVGWDEGYAVGRDTTIRELLEQADAEIAAARISILSMERQMEERIAVRDWLAIRLHATAEPTEAVEV